QQCGGDEGVEEILDGGVAAAFAATEGGDEDCHRHQRHLPERVVEEHVEGDEDAHHGDLLEQEEDIEELLAAVYRAPGDEYAERRELAGQHHQPHRETIDTDVVLNDGRGDPWNGLTKLE